MSDTVSFGSGTPTPPPRRTRKGVFAIVTVVMCLLLAGGTYAFIQADPLHLFHGGPQASEAIPDTALAYVGIDLDPSAEQQVAALTFLEHFPAFSKSTGIDSTSTDLRKVLVQDALKDSGCDLSYSQDFAPWLGTKAGVGVMPADHEGGQPVPIVAVEVSDADAAEKTLTKVDECSGGHKTGLATTGDYLVVAQTQAQAETYAKAAGASPLADDSHFKADLASLGSLGPVTAWADVAGLGRGGMMMGSELGSLGSHPMRVAATLRFTGDSAETAASIITDKPPMSGPDNAVVGLPASTVFTASLAGGGDAFAAQWSRIEKALSGTGIDVERQLKRIEAHTGLSIPTDVETLLGDNLLVSVGDSGLGDPSSLGLGGFDPSRLDVGIRFSGDKAALDDLYQRVVDLVRKQVGGRLPFTKVDFSSGFAMATNQSYAQSLANLDGDLGSSADFTSVVPDAAKARFVLYLNWNAVEKAIVDKLPMGIDPSVVDSLKPIRAVGMSVTTSGDYTQEILTVSVDD